ncbi:Acyl-[acyl-carrier-protein]--UDP-N-acetylglucosamine O-acyltransferase [Planktothrix tepida]|uniref:Acyl-[acyl-carrier-protein]--UDP-N-acetylglucosamine O-acyltransferase n=2 Tax=Planktothrix TaxID=54304 RepID=A0A1J1LMN6_9CYAN|nr:MULTISPECIES: acyl-ACP--UDP-N-acetylglucosamine O-acyltransferase [Planktothrix]CAD5921600.1 Acyl-[acyl-carrier-protein]--UDP-N-acetylglucosamine O-acyltransferase [Planktothrix pseudagardhii]CAD5981157.1 Acyl-[acyl-carrier-protein]--UDP-N-acetylglucosamine O-acyltransferase [Planktothrix tepida]CUR33747.1 UDP-N-acetylglucosamine acetyltransferase [Planktothrix tepida PCC 9214]
MTTLIHPTAVIHPGAQLHPTVQVGAYAVIGEHVKVGSDTVISSHVVINGRTEIGARNQIFPGAVIGSEPQDLKYDGSLSLVKIGDDNLIREYVTINRATNGGEATIIGNQNLLMAYVHVAHNCVIEDQVVIANSVALAGHVYIESKARLSGVLGVHQFVHIGQLAMIGGMTRIDRDVPPFMLVEGNPSRVRSLNLVGLKRAGFTSEEFSLLKKAFRLLYRSDYSFTQGLEQLYLLPDNPSIEHLRQFIRCSQTEPQRRGIIPGGKRKITED